MADGHLQYTFGFSDITGVLPEDVMRTGMLAAEFPGPSIKVKEGANVYLTLTNVGMIMRPDLFDPHSVHFHGFPNAAPIFDGEPMSSISINMGSSLTYYYTTPDPGTYMYHCHVEATEHMQMGMLANLWVTPLQDGATVGGCASQKYVFNDGDGSTCYDVDFPIQLSGFDSNFHDLHIAVQPLPFALMKDNYPMINGRGYPDTINPGPLPAPVIDGETGAVSQKVSSMISATAGQKVLLRVSSLATVDFYTLSVLGIPMRVVGRDAKILRSSSGQNLSYTTTSVTLGGGESYEVILDTAGVAPGTYFLYTTDLNNLSNSGEDFGGMMTEIDIL
ncbi:MAG: multicopper oxidase domain-containing protein [Nitrospirae bacterium]|nr:multicopper oxidase domain-containing protein [Nitrospirota bacterium]